MFLYVHGYIDMFNKNVLNFFLMMSGQYLVRKKQDLRVHTLLRMKEREKEFQLTNIEWTIT